MIFYTYIYACISPHFVGGIFHGRSYSIATPALGWDLLAQGPCCFPFFPHGQAAACGGEAASPKRGRGESGRWVVHHESTVNVLVGVNSFIMLSFVCGLKLKTKHAPGQNKKQVWWKMIFTV